MKDLTSWLEAHDKLAGWAQFLGAMLALVVIYFTAFTPIWHRKRQLRKAAVRLLANGYEVLENYHRTTPNFLPVSLTLRGAALSVGGVIEEIGRFPIYELDDQGSRSVARHLIALNGNLAATRLILEDTAANIEGRAATEGERDTLVEFLGERLEFVRNMIAGGEMIRPEWQNL
ncbi:hypothetical protein G4G27_11885 [Sphingomonas sp. So64.6b]|uniref:hypothetical protein n=1 Tax=Sphingomonas sp. So64.6b TaxID=2997354 RepID=UPI0016023979|nr:hypothetical protein [Sphingomonas sp. So64.6b]QNA84606.1 hypothetical protein G4G27_11885 [Sphingomonas sp. So64.6b]